MASDLPESLELTLAPEDNERLRNLCGQLDEHLRQVERRLGIEISNRGSHFRCYGERAAIAAAGQVLQDLYRATADEVLTPERVHLSLQESGVESLLQRAEGAEPAAEAVIRTRRGLVRPRGPNQQDYLRKMATHDINFGVGPAGTGKTYLAVACAVDSLEHDRVRRILLVRPAGRPLRDAGLRARAQADRAQRDRGGAARLHARADAQRGLHHSRRGAEHDTGADEDVPHPDRLRLHGGGHRRRHPGRVEGISFTFFSARDVVRHPLVQRIVNAYETFEHAREQK